jgi:hypothetical protein
MVTPAHDPLRIKRFYQVTVEGKIDPSWSDWLNGLQMNSHKEADGLLITVLRGPFCDQPALRGLLSRLWDLNLVLRAVQPIDPANPSEREQDKRSMK